MFRILLSYIGRPDTAAQSIGKNLVWLFGLPLLATVTKADTQLPFEAPRPKPAAQIPVGAQSVMDDNGIINQVSKFAECASCAASIAVSRSINRTRRSIALEAATRQFVSTFLLKASRNFRRCTVAVGDSLYRETVCHPGRCSKVNRGYDHLTGLLCMTTPICIVMAVFKPSRAHLVEQIHSLANQSHADFHVVFVVSDLLSDAVVIEEAQKHDLDFETYVPSEKLDAVRAFEVGLGAALVYLNTLGNDGKTGLIALCDQDDIWHPTRLEAGVRALRNEGADLVHSDARLVDEAGSLVNPSMFAHEGRVRDPGLRGLLYRNNITGMTVLMRKSLAEAALPFPSQSGVHFYHDLWLGLVAEAHNGVALISEPLVDYRQHRDNVMGAIEKSKFIPRRSPMQLIKERANILRKKAAGYALAQYLAQSLNNRMSDIKPGWNAHPNSKKIRPYFRRLRGAESFAWDSLNLLLRGKLAQAKTAAEFAIVSLGRATWILNHAFSSGIQEASEKFNIRLYSLSPGCAPKPPQIDVSCTKTTSQPASNFIDSRVKANWEPLFDAARPSFSILVPTLNPTEIFAGIATALDIGIGLAERGHRVNFIAMDLPVSSINVSKQFILSRAEGEVASKISLYCGVTNDKISCHKNDIFMATAWWTAHAASKLVNEYSFQHNEFHYLIQDYEPNFYPWGSEFAGARSSYDLKFKPIFNTSLLRDYFHQQGYTFANKSALTFHPAIDLSIYNGIRPINDIRRLVLYGRPEVARNMFPTAVEALSIFLEQAKLRPQDIELVSIGMTHSEITFSGGISIKSLGKIPWSEYPKFLLETDVGLSLMLSPHPSHPPLEMAASGAVVVTNLFDPKDLRELGGCFLSTEPTPQALAAALVSAWNMPPPETSGRKIDLTLLGRPIEHIIDAVSDDLPIPSQVGGPSFA